MSKFSEKRFRVSSALMTVAILAAGSWGMVWGQNPNPPTENSVPIERFDEDCVGSRAINCPLACSTSIVNYVECMRVDYPVDEPCYNDAPPRDCGYSDDDAVDCSFAYYGCE